MEDYVSQHKDGLAEEMMDFLGHAAHDELDEDDSGEVGYNAFLFTNEIENEEFWYDPHPDSVQEGLTSGTYIFYIFTTGWERGKA